MAKGMVWIWFGFLKVGLAWQNDGAKIYEHELTLQGKQVDFCAISSFGQGYKWHGQTCWRLGDGVAVVLVQVWAGEGGAKGG